ncbi:MAG: hypothetical protein F6J97_21040, partial [Leptolyngbya sp. SIO4C1]|nr:hypothetical protein [Leptolyngbya sp. SIO4C1]
MNALVLLIGDSDFVRDILGRVRSLEALMVESVDSLSESENRMLANPPDLAIVQATLAQPVSILQAFKRQQQLVGISFLLVEQSPTADQLPIPRMIEALDAGIDF